MADGLEDFDFGIEREAVAGLGFDGGGAAAQEPVRVAAAGGQQVIAGGLAGEADGGAYAAAGRRDLGVGGAFHAAFKLAGAVAREDRMRVSVDEAGEYDAAAGVDDFGVLRQRALDLRARPDGDDAAVAYAQCAIGDDGEFAHGGSRARTGRSREGDQLAAMDDGEISHADRASSSSQCLQPRQSRRS